MTYLLLFVGLAILTVGADLLIRGACQVAARLGLSELLIGLTIVAFGTSAPELAVSIRSALIGQDGIALGNVIGSNIFNVGCILGFTALITPVRVHRQVLYREMPILCAVTVFFVAWLYWQQGVGRWTGLLLLGGLAAQMVAQVREEKKAAAKFPLDMSSRHKAGPLPRNILLVLAGLALLVFGARLFVDNAVQIAQSLGVGEEVIGLTIVAAGTSLPELATSAVAALRGKSDIAVGNVVGSNLFNILSIAGMTAVIKPLSLGGIRVIDLGFLLVTTLILVPMMLGGLRIGRVKGCLLLGIFGAYLYSVWP